MFRAKTVLVIGAGASVEVGLPMGADLLKQIVEMTSFRNPTGSFTGDIIISQALMEYLDEGIDRTKYFQHIEAGSQIGKSAKQALSIDNVIDALENPKIELVGKLGIARAILDAESKSKCFKFTDNIRYNLNLSNFDATWYSSLTKILTENTRKSDVNHIFKNFEIINFNYDRCLEHYLPISLASYYGITPGDIQDVMQGLVIHRPYGIAGRLPWQKGSGHSVDFGECTPAQLAAIVQQIRTFTERVEEGKDLAAMRKAIGTADRIVFLGFAFHRQNVELLTQEIQSHAEIVATAYKISPSDKSVIISELQSAFNIAEHSRIELADMTCAQFFTEYSRTLTAKNPKYRMI
jgi:hypothetical protein